MNGANMNYSNNSRQNNSLGNTGVSKDGGNNSPYGRKHNADNKMSSNKKNFDVIEEIKMKERE